VKYVIKEKAIINKRKYSYKCKSPALKAGLLVLKDKVA